MCKKRTSVATEMSEQFNGIIRLPYTAMATPTDVQFPFMQPLSQINFPCLVVSKPLTMFSLSKKQQFSCPVTVHQDQKRRMTNAFVWVHLNPISPPS